MKPFLVIFCGKSWPQIFHMYMPCNAVQTSHTMYVFQQILKTIFLSYYRLRRTNIYNKIDSINNWRHGRHCKRSKLNKMQHNYWIGWGGQIFIIKLTLLITGDMVGIVKEANWIRCNTTTGFLHVYNFRTKSLFKQVIPHLLLWYPCYDTTLRHERCHSINNNDTIQLDGGYVFHITQAYMIVLSVLWSVKTIFCRYNNVYCLTGDFALLYHTMLTWYC